MTAGGKSGGHAIRRTTTARSLAGAAVVLALALALAAQARAASAPSVSTGSAAAVEYATATLTGSVDPNGYPTSYYFQYGVTRSYGGQTAIASAGSGGVPISVRLPVGGLQPLTLYHYRLVAVNGHGPTIGGDHTFLTTKVPLSLSILATPDPVAFGGAVTIAGTLSGTGNAGRAVVLQADPFPFKTGLQTIGNPQLTSASGGFSFPILGLTTVTQFRVLTTTKPPVSSLVTVADVAVRVSSHIARTARPGFARFYGTVSPAEDGMQIGILRISHGHGALVGGTILRHLNAAGSRYSRVVRVRPGVYRVLARVTSGAQVSSYGPPLVIR